MGEPDDEVGKGPSIGPTKAERLQVFYQELMEAPSATSMDEAVEMLARILVAVEDRLSGIEAGSGREEDGRMYPARADNRHDVQGRSDIVRLRSKAHNSYVSTGGAILIVDLRGEVAVSKAGADGKVIEL